MSEHLEAAKQRLYQRTVFAQSGRKAIGRMEDVNRSIEGEGILKSTLEFADGVVTLRVVVEPDGAITSKSVAKEIEITGIDLGGKDGGAEIEVPGDLSEVATVEDLITAKISEPEQPAKPPVAPPPPAAKHNGRRSVFTDNDVERMIKLWGQGNKAVRIAEIMKRDARQVANFTQRNRDKFPIEKKPSEQASSPTAPTPPAIPTGDQSGWTLLERQTAARLNNIPFVKTWSAERDLLLVETLVAGEGLDQAATALKISARDCKARWHLLLPEVTIEDQAAVVRVLRSWAQRCAPQ